jgi:hypothetical protein
MSIVKKSDVKNHLSPFFRTQIHLCPPESQPDATGFSAAEADAVQASALSFAEDFVQEHSTPGTVLAQDDPAMGSYGPQTPATSKRVQP